MLLLINCESATNYAFVFIILSEESLNVFLGLTSHCSSNVHCQHEKTLPSKIILKKQSQSMKYLCGTSFSLISDFNLALINMYNLWEVKGLAVCSDQILENTSFL